VICGTDLGTTEPVVPVGRLLAAFPVALLATE
jgi:hypothetical protein